MSAVSGLGSNAQGLYQFFQSLSGTGASQTSATGASTGTSSTTAPGTTAQAITQAAQSIGQALPSGHHHHHGGALKQIQDAVTSALQSAQSTGSASSPNKIVEDAIAKVLGNNNTGVSSTRQDADGDNDGSTGASTSATANMQSFFQTLQSFGVSPQQFQQDLLSAVKDAQNGTVNTSTAFQNFPVGSTLDTVG